MKFYVFDLDMNEQWVFDTREELMSWIADEFGEDYDTADLEDLYIIHGEEVFL